MVNGFCGDKIVTLSNAATINAVLKQALSSDGMCLFLAPTGARVPDINAGSYSTFQVLADDTPSTVEPIAAVSCKNIDFF